MTPPGRRGHGRRWWRAAALGASSAGWPSSSDAWSGSTSCREPGERALAARAAAAEAFAEQGQELEAATEQLAAASHLQSAASLTSALDLVVGAGSAVERTGSVPLRVRALSLEGQIRTKLGDTHRGVELAREGLALALVENLTDPAAEAYYRLASALEHAADYPQRSTPTRPPATSASSRASRAWGGVLLLPGAGDGQDRRVGSRRRVCRAILDARDAPAPARMVAAAELGVARSTELLSQTAGTLATTEAVAGLGHALGELALTDGDAAGAAQQFTHVLDLLSHLSLPYERAETELRAASALAAAGERGLAIDHLTFTYRAARRLGARPLAREAAEELARLGEKVERRLGRRAAGQLEHAGLSRREVEVLRLVSVGRTNREIAQGLFLSPRTVDMHVRNILTKLDCRSRTEATRRAAELGLLESRP